MKVILDKKVQERSLLMASYHHFIASEAARNEEKVLLRRLKTTKLPIPKCGLKSSTFLSHRCRRVHPIRVTSYLFGLSPPHPSTAEFCICRNPFCLRAYTWADLYYLFVVLAKGRDGFLGISSFCLISDD